MWEVRVEPLFFVCLCVCFLLLYFMWEVRVEPFAVLSWALVIVLLQQVTQPTGLASLIRGTGTLLYGRGQLGST